MKSKHDDHNPRVVLVPTAADHLKAVMAVVPSKVTVDLLSKVGMVSLLSKVGMVSLLSRVGMVSLLQVRDNTDSHQEDMAARGSSNQAAMGGHHQTNLPTAVNRVAMVLLRHRRGTE